MVVWSENLVSKVDLGEGILWLLWLGAWLISVNVSCMLRNNLYYVGFKVKCAVTMCNCWFFYFSFFCHCSICLLLPFLWSWLLYTRSKLTMILHLNFHLSCNIILYFLLLISHFKGEYSCGKNFWEFVWLGIFLFHIFNSLAGYENLDL